jgi:hypothetical protein
LTLGHFCCSTPDRRKTKREPAHSFPAAAVEKTYTCPAPVGSVFGQAIEIRHFSFLGTGLARTTSSVHDGLRAAGERTLNTLAIQRESQLEQEIAQLSRRVCGDGTKPDSLRTRCARAYIKELLKFKRESLELLRFRRVGRQARWQRRPELH